MMLGAFLEPQKNEAGGGTLVARAGVCTLEGTLKRSHVRTYLGAFKGLYI